MKFRLVVLLSLLAITIVGGGYFFWYQYTPLAEIDLGILNKPVITTDLGSNKLATNQNQPATNDNIITTEPVFKSDPTHSIQILSVPFTPQAPDANWDQLHNEACEEASMIMAGEYFKGNKTLKLEPTYAEAEILKLADWETKHGYSQDVTAQEVVAILKDYYNLSAIVAPYNHQTIKETILKRQLVLLPAAGRLLGNPYYKRPGPLYHMLVVRGFDSGEFITNDPGTKRGLNYRYTEEVLSQAVHDWNQGKVEEGKQVMIVVNGLLP